MNKRGRNKEEEEKNNRTTSIFMMFRYSILSKPLRDRYIKFYHTQETNAHRSYRARHTPIFSDSKFIVLFTIENSSRRNKKLELRLKPNAGNS